MPVECDGEAQGAAAAGAGSTTSPQNYWSDLLEHLEALRPLGNLPALPSDRALDVVLRAVANVLCMPIHLARLDALVPELLVYAETPGRASPRLVLWSAAQQC